MAYMLLISITSNTDAHTGQWRKGPRACRAVAIPIAGYGCRESAGKTEGRPVRLVKIDLVSWGLQ